ncbi:MAG: homoserine O-acetyltransferase [Akkermansia sp.]
MSTTNTHTIIHDLGDFTFDSGETLPHVQLAYECYGQLNEAKDNVILLNHALTGSHHAHGWCDSLPEAEPLWMPENFEGWWNLMIGPDKPLDTNKYFIVCANYLGGCYGSTGPSSTAPDGKPWGGRFPLVKARDQARAFMLLLDSMGVDKFRLVAPSVGGLCGLVNAILYPERVTGLLLIGVGYKISIEHRLSVFEQILAVEMDEQFCAGHYDPSNPPNRGLALARIICHKLFVDQSQLDKRARKGVIAKSPMLNWYQATRNTESYMLHQGTKFAKRFDANSYLRIINMWGSYDVAQLCGKKSVDACFRVLAEHHIPVQLFSISTDYCFTPREIAAYHRKMVRNGVDAQYHCIKSSKGHDSFLLEPELYEADIKQFLEDSKA